MFNRFPGGHRSRVTPVPIPNTEVKLATADGTAWATAWESRSLPGIFIDQSPLLARAAGFFCFPVDCAHAHPDAGPRRLRPPGSHHARPARADCFENDSPR